MANYISEKVAISVFLVGDTGLEDYTTEELVVVLKECDDLYYNTEAPDGIKASGSFLTDEQYDSVRSWTYQNAPHHVYFTGVGSTVRTGKIKLPYQMGSLDQVEIGEILDWVGNWSLQQQFMIITDKLDGTSAMVIYDDNGDLQIAYSRGNGVEGADITRHIKHLVPANIGQPAVIRGEVIIPKYSFEDARSIAKSRSGQLYKNARNMVAGLMNAKSNPTDVYSHIHFVAYDILGFDGIDKINMLTRLQQYGFKTPFWTSMEGRELADSILARHINQRRRESEYEIDGIVIDVNLAAKRKQMNPTRDTLNPAYAVKYKVADASNVAIANVVDVHWAASKHGYLKPRIEIDPVDLVGVTVRHATGFNAKFIYDNKIGPGAKIQITRSGDVIPFCQRVIEGTEPKMPDADYTWTENDQGEKVDIILDDHHLNDDVRINRITDFFAAIDAPMLRKGSVTKLYEYKFKTIEEIIKLPEARFVGIIGENGKKIYAGLRKALTDIPLYKLLGAHSNERGLGVRKMKKLQQALGADRLYTGHKTELTFDEIAAVEGFDVKTAKKVITALNEFVGFMENVGEYVTIAAEEKKATGSSMEGQKVVFTGFRDKELQEAVEAAGGTMQSAVSSKTTILVSSNPTSNSGKMKKARDLGVQVMGIDEFKEMV